MAWAIAGAKCQRPGVCNAMETLLVHKDIAAEYLPKMGAIFNKQNVTLLGDRSCQQIPSGSACQRRGLARGIPRSHSSIRVVDHIEEAIDHINCQAIPMLSLLKMRTAKISF